MVDIVLAGRKIVELDRVWEYTHIIERLGCSGFALLVGRLRIGNV